ncbi:tetratricopeptide repeat protein [Sphingoaurantiacus capsulatus]|uniref:Tetratricopeptide repeat protein n=1 Tax=Sphingoaurantiacus capsulatus TaxID=1771310 RepID=A0ABV7X9R2_9SPHN
MRRLTLALLIGLTATAAYAQRNPADRDRYGRCIAETRSDAAKAVETANNWRAAGGGLPARHCLAMAYLAQERFAPAAVALEQAARAAEAERDPAAADLWGQAGNAALLAGDTEKAHAYLSSALLGAGPDNQRRGQLLIDRARASVELAKPSEARADLDQAIRLMPKEPAAWLLSATLARRQGELLRASSEIAEAAKLVPNDPDILLEQGNIAGAQGDPAAARTAWDAVVKASPDSPAGKEAAKALAANAAPAK